MIRSMVADEMYYPGEPEELRYRLRRALAESPSISGGARVVVGPYGAYDLTLPYVMRALKAAAAVKPSVILVVAPPNAPSEQVVLPESEAFATPFGTLPVDHAVISQLTSSSTLFQMDEFAHLRDHSIETMLPALHVIFGTVPIVPLLVGSIPFKSLLHGARIISAALKGRDFLTVVSANLSGFTSPGNADARARGMVRLLMESPGPEILDATETLESPPRSLWPIILGHLLAGPDARPRILDRGTFETDYDGHTAGVVLAAIAYT